MNKHLFIAIDQPMGRFYATRINASELIPIAQSNVRSAYNSMGIQRALKADRVNAISEYCKLDNAVFPTPIILSGKSDYFQFESIKDESVLSFTDIDSGYMKIDSESIINSSNYLSIVDGQHRLAGIAKSGNESKFNLLVLFIFDTEAYQDAEIFSTINRNQKQVSKSLVYDLYGLTDIMTVEKFAHEMVYAMNKEHISMMRDRVKMLGYKTDDFGNQGARNPYVSQAAIVDELLPMISPDIRLDNTSIYEGKLLRTDLDSSYILRPYFTSDSLLMAQVHIISFFNAWLDSLQERGYEGTILFKTVGFIVSLGVFREIFPKIVNKDDEDSLLEEYSGLIYSDARTLADGMVLKYQGSYKSYIERLNFENVNMREISSSQSGASRLLRDILKE